MASTPLDPLALRATQLVQELRSSLEQVAEAQEAWALQLGSEPPMAETLAALITALHEFHKDVWGVAGEAGELLRRAESLRSGGADVDPLAAEGR